MFIEINFLVSEPSLPMAKLASGTLIYQLFTTISKIKCKSLTSWTVEPTAKWKCSNGSGKTYFLSSKSTSQKFGSQSLSSHRRPFMKNLILSQCLRFIQISSIHCPLMNSSIKTTSSLYSSNVLDKLEVSTLLCRVWNQSACSFTKFNCNLTSPHQKVLAFDLFVPSWCSSLKSRNSWRDICCSRERRWSIAIYISLRFRDASVFSSRYFAYDYEDSKSERGKKICEDVLREDRAIRPDGSGEIPER